METILIIEDNADIRENTCELLELDGFNVLVADSGKTGLKLAHEKKPDVIFCDIKMREIDGYAVLKELRKHSETASIPVIFLSSLGEPREIKIAIALGANAFIRKPFSEKDLIECISMCVGKSANGLMEQISEDGHKLHGQFISV